MRKKGGKMQIIDNEQRPKRRVRRKKQPKLLGGASSSYGSIEDSNEEMSKDPLLTREYINSASTEIETRSSAEETSKASLTISEYNKSDSIGIVTGSSAESLCPIITGSESHENHYDAAIASEDEYEYVTDDDDSGEPGAAAAKGSSSVSLAGPIIGSILALIFIIGPLVCFITFGIIFLVEDKDLCHPNLSLLWIWGVVFMITFFPSSFIVPNYKWGALVWSILFLMELPLIIFPHLSCPEMLHAKLYTWSLWAFWLLVAHLVISLIAFIVSLATASAASNKLDAGVGSVASNTANIVHITDESTPLVRTIDV
jgi:hypothetical protein